jgi:hypothetical protein
MDPYRLLLVEGSADVGLAADVGRYTGARKQLEAL